jgi:hypothetical protein
MRVTVYLNPESSQQATVKYLGLNWKTRVRERLMIPGRFDDSAENRNVPSSYSFSYAGLSAARM